MNGLAVACRRVVHIYRAEAGDVVALAGVDLSISPGETLALVGPSGSGKSTLTAPLAGLVRPAGGRGPGGWARWPVWTCPSRPARRAPWWVRPGPASRR